jgi:Flp pilus assembly protein TadG
MVEMALVLPVFVMITLGIVEFGRAMMVGQLVTNAAREGARLGVVDGSTNNGVETFVKNFLHETVNVATGDVAVTITVTEAPGNPAAGNTIEAASAKDLVTVKVQLPFDKVSYVAGSYLNGKSLVGVSAMRHE